MARGRQKHSLTVDLGSRPQVRAVALDLMRLIHVEALLPGDLLPSQARLRERAGFHNNTLNPAMQLLVDSGLIRREARSGTVVVDQSRPVPGLWRVGLGAPQMIAKN